MRKRFSILVALTALLFGGCQIERIVIEEPVRDRFVEVCTDDHVVVRLDENATTGYQWTVRCADPLVNVTIEHEGPDLDDRRCGAPGLATVHLRVRRGFVGPSVVYLRSERSWSGECARKVKLQLHRRITDVAVWK